MCACVFVCVRMSVCVCVVLQELDCCCFGGDDDDDDDYSDYRDYGDDQIGNSDGASQAKAADSNELVLSDSVILSLLYNHQPFLHR